MTDFFAQMQARYRGEAGVLHPRVPFRFEPVGASLAAADLTGGPAAAPGGRGAHPGGPARSGEPWTALAAGDQPTSAITLAPGPQPASPRPVGRARLSRDGAADLSATGPAGEAAPGGTWRAGQGPAPEGTGATTARPQAPSARDRASRRVPMAPNGAAVLGPDMLELAERGTPPVRQAMAQTAEPGMSRPGAATRTAEQIVRREWRPGSGGDPAEADPMADADAWPARRRSPSVLRPDPGGTGRPWSVAPPAGQRGARDHAGREPSGPGPDAITVQVTIGRVEVRAASPAGPTAAGAAAASRPAVGPSLADYLRHRSRSAGARS